MLKRKRKINKQALIANSRRYMGPLPLAYAELIRRGTAPAIAKAMVVDACGVFGCRDDFNLGSVVAWYRTNYYHDWLKAACV